MKKNSKHPVAEAGKNSKESPASLKDINVDDSQENCKAVLRMMPDHVFIQDAALRYRMVVNPQGGLAKQDMLGKTDHDFLSKEDADKLAGLKRKVLDTGLALSVETSLMISPGVEEFFSGHYVPKFNADGKVNGLIGYFRNVTDQVRSAELLRESQQRYRSLFEGMMDGFALHEIICDDMGKPVDYRFLDINPAFEKQTGLKAADIIGKTVRGIMPRIEAYWIEAYGQVALTGQAASFENYSQELGRYYEVVAFCPAKMQFAVFCRDVTESKKAAQELLVAKEKAETANKVKSELLANISHDLRTPMNAILGFSAMLGSVESAEKRKKYIDIIQTKAKGLLVLIEDILDGSSIESGKVILRSAFFDLGKVLRDAVETARNQSVEKGLTVSFLADPLPRVKGDEIRVGQIITNLLSNAVKYTDKGGVSVCVLCADKEGDSSRCRISIAVKDTGLGISPGHLPYIYDAFARFHEFAGGKSRQGVGLGLYITKKLIDLMGGHMEVISEVGRGSEFIVVLVFDKEVLNNAG
ncbi:MAG: ATP-binding protein [Candidatus Omnitrophota bacterium]